jgi:phage/plasmid-associated DNA primase
MLIDVAPVAQLDRAIASGAIGREFESLRAHQISSFSSITSGLGLPAVVEAASKSYRDENDQIGEFISDRCLVSEDACVSAGTLWSAYLFWAADSQERPLDRRVSLPKRLEARLYFSGARQTKWRV